MNNPFEVIEARLSSIENLILDLKHQPKQAEPTPSPHVPVEIDRVCEILHKAKPTVYTRARKREISSYNVGGKLLFFEDELMSNIQLDRRISSRNPISSREEIVMNKNEKAANLERNSHKTQLQTIFLYLQDHVATASMVAQATGVPQKCITRYKRYLEKNGMLWEVTRKYCQHTGFKAYYLTTDPVKVTKCSFQLNLF